jgi:aspartate aminotransferase
MPEISKRGRALPSSPIRRLAPLAVAARQRGIHVYGLNIGQPDLPTPVPFWNAVRSLPNGTLDYSPSPGFESLRQKWAKFYKRYGAELTAENIIVTNGGSEAIGFALMAITDPGDEIVVAEPMYANYITYAQSAGVKVVPLTCRIEDGYDLPNDDALRAAVTERTRAIVVCNPSNPTGKLLSDREWERVAALAEEKDLYVVSDEAYRDFRYDGSSPETALARASLAQRAIVIDTVSKRYSACGARVGALVTKNADVLAVAMKCAQARLSPPSLGQIGAEALFDLPEAYYDWVREEYRARRDFLHQSLVEIEGVVCPKPDGAFYLMPRLPVANAEDFCRFMLEKFSHEGKTVMLAPGEGFHATPGLGRDTVRMAYVLNIAALENAVVCLKRGLAAFLG